MVGCGEKKENFREKKVELIVPVMGLRVVVNGCTAVAWTGSLGVEREG